MPWGFIDDAPSVADFILLSDHQAQTPSTFFGGKPVLHLHAPIATLKVPVAAAQQQGLSRLVGDNNSAAAAAAAIDGNVEIPGIDVWVTSRSAAPVFFFRYTETPTLILSPNRYLLLYSSAQSCGLQIPYPTITVTAQDGADVLLELNLSDPDTADEDLDFLQLRIHATSILHHSPASDTSAGAAANGTTSQNDTATALFKAISDCQELNPDPPQAGGDSDDGGGEADLTAPGATGWITSENMAEFMDENGILRMPGSVTVVDGEDRGENQQHLGEGAGRTRTAAEIDAEEGSHENGGDDAKWQRTG